jgi:hypothetical protein
MQTLERFIGGYEIRMGCREVTLSGDGFLIADPRAAKQYLCELHDPNGDRRVTTIVASDNWPPEVDDVLDTLAAAAAVVEESGCYEDWAEQMGFDPDSHHGRRAYRIECRQAWLLRGLLGSVAYRKLLWETERL